jgi:hypothetical protein
MRGFAVAAVAGACLLVAAPVAAEPAGRLVYRRGAGATGCPDESALRKAVAARLGEDPFDDAQPSMFDVTVMRDGDGFAGRVALVDTNGHASGVRHIRGASSCAELVDALALGLSLAINPELATTGPESHGETVLPPVVPLKPAPEPKQGAEPTPVPADEPPEPQPVENEPAWGFAAGVVGLASVGTAPQAALGVGVLLRGRYRVVSLSVEGRYDAPSSKLQDNGAEVETRLMAALLVPCLHFRPLPVQACAVGALGSLRGEAPNLPNPQPDTGLYAAVGARGVLELDQLRFVRFQARLDLLASLVPLRVTRNGGGDELWEMPRISGTLGLGALFEIP